MSSTPLRPEILVAGAGPGGSAAAWALAQAGHDVLLVDRAEFPRDKTCGDSPDGARPSDAAKGYPLRIDFPAQRAAGENWAAVGESSGLVNPVTGKGIDLALESGLMAARTLHADIRQGRADHQPYQRELWDRFGPMFTGLRMLRDIIVTPLFTDYALLLMRQHRFLARTVIKMVQGLAPPQSVFHPLFILQFFMPLTPRFALEQLGARDAGRQPRVGR